MAHEKGRTLSCVRMWSLTFESLLNILLQALHYIRWFWRPVFSLITCIVRQSFPFFEIALGFGAEIAAMLPLLSSFSVRPWFSSLAPIRRFSRVWVDSKSLGVAICVSPRECPGLVKADKERGTRSFWGKCYSRFDIYTCVFMPSSICGERLIWAPRSEQGFFFTHSSACCSSWIFTRVSSIRFYESASAEMRVETFSSKLRWSENSSLFVRSNY